MVSCQVQSRKDSSSHNHQRLFYSLGNLVWNETPDIAAWGCCCQSRERSRSRGVVVHTVEQKCTLITSRWYCQKLRQMQQNDNKIIGRSLLFLPGAQQASCSPCSRRQMNTETASLAQGETDSKEFITQMNFSHQGANLYCKWFLQYTFRYKIFKAELTPAMSRQLLLNI